MGKRGRQRERRLAVGGDPLDRGAALLRDGSVARAIRILEALCKQDPHADEAHELYAQALQTAHRRQVTPSSLGCPCGSGRPYGVCCQPAERQALERFEDRQPFYRLRDHLFRYLSDIRFEATRVRAFDAWCGERGADLGPASGLPALFPLEWACCALDLKSFGEGEGLPLAAFCQDRVVLGTIAGQARQWLSSGRYGLWECPSAQASPGVWLTDSLSGFRRYVSIPPEHLSALGPWSVLGVQLLAIDGIWRTGGVVLPMDPATGAQMDLKLREVANRVVAGDFRRERTSDEHPPEEPATPAMLWADIVSQLAGAAMPSIAAALAAPPDPVRLRNLDGEPLVLISARIDVADPEGLAERLANHADVVQTDDVAFVWQGSEMRPVHAEPLVAEARALAAASGTELAPHVGPRRITQAELRLEGNCLVAEVNSEARLERLVAFLDGLGACPELVAKEVTAAEQVMSASAALRVDSTYIAAAGASEEPPEARERGHGLGPEAVRAWQSAWVDQPLPALSGLTPRAAAKDAGARRDLEVLLRNIEHRSARPDGAAYAAIDVNSLRSELAMPSVAAIEP